jgi:vacuolar iron transporter family protein
LQVRSLPRQLVIAEALAAGVALVVGCAVRLLVLIFIPGPSRPLVTFAIALLAPALTGSVSARMSDVHPPVPTTRTAGTGVVAMAITYLAGRVIQP